MLRESIIWLPLYLFLLVFILMNFGIRGLLWSLGLICAASICDIISSHVIKEQIMRIRPCRSPDIAHQVRFLVAYCPQSSSFISSHAANHFGVSMFIYVTLRQYISWTWLFFVWAAVISYAQVYVGVHFPGDVFCGGLAGCFLGYVPARLFNKYFSLVPSLK